MSEDIFVAKIEGVFVNGKKESIWRKSKSSILREETYKNGLLHGISRVFANDGKLLYQTIFEDGAGYYKEYYNDSKQLFLEGEMLNGKRIGTWQYYSKTGYLERIETYKDGQLHGLFCIRDKNNKELYSTEFKNGIGWFKLLNSQTNELIEEKGK